MQSRDGPCPNGDRLRASGQQHLDGFPVSAAARLAEAHTGERLPGRSHSVDIVAFTPPRRAGRWGRSTSTIRSQQASSAVVSPAPKLPAPSMAHNVALWRRPNAISWRSSRIGGIRQTLEHSAGRADRRRGVVS
jgi:hypothetical protein